MIEINKTLSVTSNVIVNRLFLWRTHARLMHQWLQRRTYLISRTCGKALTSIKTASQRKQIRSRHPWWSRHPRNQCQPPLLWLASASVPGTGNQPWLLWEPGALGELQKKHAFDQHVTRNIMHRHSNGWQLHEQIELFHGYACIRNFYYVDLNVWRSPILAVSRLLQQQTADVNSV